LAGGRLSFRVFMHGGVEGGALFFGGPLAGIFKVGLAGATENAQKGKRGKNCNKFPPHGNMEKCLTNTSVKFIYLGALLSG